MQNYEIIKADGGWVAFIYDPKHQDKEWWGEDKSQLALMEAIAVHCGRNAPFSIRVFQNTVRGTSPKEGH